MLGTNKRGYTKWREHYSLRKNITYEITEQIDGKLLKVNCTLKQLWIYNSAITDIQSIGEALKTNNTLEDLILVNNNITDVKSIGKALETNNTLTIVDSGIGMTKSEMILVYQF